MNKTVIITGATSGYGLAAAKKFKENGDTVIIASRNAEKVKNTVAEYGFDDGFVLDVTDFGKWEELKKYVCDMLDYCVFSSRDMMTAMESDPIVADAYGAAVQNDIICTPSFEKKSTATGTRLSKRLKRSSI